MSVMNRIGTLTSVLLGAVVLSLGVTGCGTPPAQQAANDESAGDSALASSNYTGAVDDYRNALNEAQKAKQKDSTFDVTPYEQKLQTAVQDTAVQAQKDADQGKDLANTDPFAAKSVLDQANKLAGQNYGNAPQVTAEVASVMAEPQMLPVRVAEEMDSVTDSINNWLFWTNYYQNPGDLPDLWTISNYIEVENRMGVLESMLDQWQAQGSQTATMGLAQLEEVRSTLTLWQQWQVIQAYANGNSSVYQAMNANYMIQFLSAHAQLRATLRGTTEINTWLLQQYWGVTYYSSAGYYNGNYYSGPYYAYTGYSNTGDGGTGSTGNGDGSSNTGNGDGSSNTGSGDGSSTGSGYGDGSSTGSGDGSSTGSGYGDGSSTGSGDGSSSTGSGDGGSSTGSGDGSGYGSNTGTGNGSSTGSGTGSGTGNGDAQAGTANDPFADINR